MSPTGEKGNGTKPYVSQKWKCGTYTVLNIIQLQKNEISWKMAGLGMYNIKQGNSKAERKTQIHLLPQKQNLPCNKYVAIYKEL